MEMSDIFDYILWRGDLTFSQTGLNCVDSLIFSQMAYFPLDGLWSEAENGKVTIGEACRRLHEKENLGETIPYHLEKDRELFRVMADSLRFGNLVLRDFVNWIDTEKEKQFAAVTVELPDSVCIIYRGTDNTLVGWKEDFNMSFSTPVPAQIDAVKYIHMISDRVMDDFIVCGHSKGGNLAVYAALFCDDPIRKRIKQIYNHDGPGFDGRVVPRTAFLSLAGKLHTFVPQSSVIGMLMDHEENYIVVKSRQIGVLQHDLYSWEVMGPDFVRLESVTDGSRFVDRTIKEWLSRMNSSQRETFIDTLFSVLGAADISSFTEMKDNVLKHSSAIMRAILELEPETRRAMLKILYQLVDSAQDTIPEFLPEKMIWGSKQNAEKKK